MTFNIDNTNPAVELGRKGGQASAKVRTAAKAQASRANGAKGGRPRADQLRDRLYRQHEFEDLAGHPVLEVWGMRFDGVALEFLRDSGSVWATVIVIESERLALTRELLALELDRYADTPLLDEYTVFANSQRK